jgi:hypothetical protein
MTITEKQRQPAECIIWIDDREITSLYPFLRSINVETSRKAASVCRLTFDSLRNESGFWNVQDSGWFIPWRRIRIEAKFGQHTEEVMRGYIKDIKADYPSDMSAATVMVNGQDESLVLDREHTQAVYSSSEQPLTDGEIVERIAHQHGLNVQASKGLKNASLNYDGTPIRFLLERAEANGFEFLVRQGKIYFGPSELEGEAQAKIMVYAGDSSNCNRFSVQHDGHKPDKVRLVSAPETGTETISDTLSPGLKVLGKKPANSQNSGLKPFIWNLDRSNGATVSELRARAQAKADQAAWKLMAEGELDGTLYGHVLLTHRTVAVDGIGETYGGIWYVDEVNHEFSLDGYRQTFRLIRNATGESVENSRPDRLALVRR